MPAQISTETVKKARALHNEYQRIRAKEKDPKCKVINIGRRVTLELKLLKLILRDLDQAGVLR